MEKELREYNDIIHKLKPLIRSADFNRVFKQLARDIPADKRFLIKMELNRLAKPCMRSIDLRGLVDGECRLVEFEGRQHFLDPVAEEVFQTQTQIFGLYCFGVYEAVMATENNYRVMRQKSERKAKLEEQQNMADEPLNRYTMPVIDLLSYANRTHERMNFAIAIEIKDEFGKSYSVTSVDISQIALRLKIPRDLTFSVQQRLYVFFRGLEDEYAMDKENGVAYSVITSREENGSYYLILNRETSLSSPSFDKFLDQFIHGNKRRYKVNLANTIEAIENKSAEQYISTCSPSLPVFIDEQQEALVPRYTLVNAFNRGVLDYWHDENHVLKLGMLLSPERLRWLKSSLSSARALYVYSFIHFRNGSIQFYSATNTELAQQPQLKPLFVGFGSRKVSWRIFKISMTEVSPRDAYVPSSIPPSFNEKVKGLNITPSARLLAQMKYLRYAVHITDVTSQEGQDLLAERPFDRSQLTKLKAFTRSKDEYSHLIKIYSYRLYEQKLKTSHLVRRAVQLIDSSQQAIKGFVNEIALNTLRLELSEFYSGKPGDRVKLQFARKGGQTEGEALLYEVVHINTDRRILSLNTLEGKAGEDARQFAEAVIDNITQRLEAYTAEEEIQGVKHALRCINARNTPNFAYLLAMQSGKLSPLQAVLSDADKWVNKVACHNGGERFVNVEFLYREDGSEKPLVTNSFTTIQKEPQPIRVEAFISFNENAKKGRLAIIPRLANSFVNTEYSKQFIENAMTTGRFMAVEIFITPAPKPDLSMISAELKYVSVYALHKAKALEEQIWSVAVTVHIVDVTEEVLSRFDVSRQHSLESNTVG